RRTSLMRRSSGSSRTIARLSRSSRWRTLSSRTIASGSGRTSGPISTRATFRSSASSRTSTRRRAMWPGRSIGWPTRARPAARWPEILPGLGTAAVKPVGRFMSIMERLQERVDSAGVADLLQETLQETGYMDALRAERMIEAEGRIENLDELVSVAREYEAAP